MAEEVGGSAGDLAGRTFGQYEIIRKLGDGGMASVYLARQQSIGRLVAVKVLPAHFLHDSSFMQRFETEVKIAADLQHPRVLPVYDFGLLDGQPFIVMAYMAGGTLADRIQQGPMPLEDIVRITGQVAEGLDHAHARGVVHRDFKPSNVLLDENGNAYLADFGIAKISESTANLTGSGVVGTPAYMAPEMGSEGVVAPSVDIYALGVTLFQMLTGQYPYSGETPLSVMMAHVTKPIPDVRQLRPDLPHALVQVLERVLAKSPGDRYPTAGALAESLRLAAGEPGVDEAYPPTRPVTVPPHPRTPTPAPGADDEWLSAPSTPTPAPAPAGWDAPAPEPPAAPRTPPPPERRGIGRGTVAIVAGALLLAVVGCVAVFFIFDGPALFSRSTPAPADVAVVEDVAPVTPEAFVPTEEVALPAGPGTTFYVDNLSSVTVCNLLLSPSDSEDWGEDQLGSETVINSGGSFTVTDVPPGRYDYQALDCDGNTLDGHYGVELGEGGFTWTIRDATDQLVILNNSSLDVCYVYASSLEDSYWGADRLGAESTVPIGGQTVVYLQPGSYDLRAEACDGDTYWEEYSQTITGGYEWTLTD